MAAKVHDEASVAAAEAGIVLVEGPDGVAVSLTPDAATATGDRIKAAGGRAQAQRDGRAPPIEP